MRRRLILICVGALLVTTAIAAQQIATDDEAKPLHGDIMQTKLRAAQEVLAGLSQQNFETIEKQAELLHLLSFEAGWNRIQTREYKRLSEDFRATTVQLSKSAKKKNLDAVALAYVKLSISCVECHRHAEHELND